MFTVESLCRYICPLRYSICNMALFSCRCIWLNSVMACTVELCQSADSQWFVKLPFCPSALERVIKELGSYFYLLCVCLVIQAICYGFFFFLFSFLNGTRLIYVSRSDDFVSSTLKTKWKTAYVFLIHLSNHRHTPRHGLSHCNGSCTHATL